MRYTVRLTVIFSLVTVLLFSAFPALGKQDQPRRPGALLYKIREGAAHHELGALNGVLNALGASNRKVLRGIGVNLDEYPQGLMSEEAACEKLMATGAVVFAEPDYLVEPAVVPNDPGFGSQWQHTAIRTPEAWEITTGNQQVIVAVCDTGISSGHPDLAANLLLPGYNAVDGTTNTEPVFNHGTGVAGCIGAAGNNGLGVAGVAWNIRILPVRITNDASGSAYVSVAADGIRYAADHGARVANLSYLMAGYSAIDTAAQYLRGKGGLLFVAAGNDGADPGWPDFSSFIAVGATTSTDVKASWSNYGTYIDIVAPGSGVYSTTGTSSYGYMSGTSFSSPIAAGVAALVFAANPAFTPEQAESFIFGACKDLGTAGEDDSYGHGLVDAARTLELAGGFEVNYAPVAVISVDPDEGYAPLTITADGTGSYDPDGRIVSWSWDFGDGRTETGSSVSHEYTADGTYAIRLTVTDDRGASASSSAQVVVYPDPNRVVYVGDIRMSLASVPGGEQAQARVLILNQEPNVVAGALVTGQWTGSKTGTASGTTDTDGFVILTSPKAKGDVAFTFTVTDVSASGYTYDSLLNMATSGTISNTVPGNLPPTARATADPSSGRVPLPVLFDASGSYDPDGSIAACLWDFGDGTGAEGISTSHTYQAAGTYQAVLTVRDNEGAASTAELVITVLPDGDAVIFVGALSLQLVQAPGGDVGRATVTVLNTGNQPVSGVRVTGLWEGIVSGTAEGLTNADGSVTLDSKKTRQSGTVTFTVTGLSLDGYVYDPGMNSETTVSTERP